MGEAFLEVLNADDISAGGLGVRVPHGLSADEVKAEVDLIVTLPGQKPFMAKGNIVHRTGIGKEKRFGVAFTELGDGDRARIEAYVKQLLGLGRRT